MANALLDQAEKLADQLSFEEQLSLLEYLAQQLRHRKQQGRPQSLYGIWMNRFPSDFDIDAATKDIRSAWQRNESEGLRT